MHTRTAGLLLATNKADIFDVMTNILEDFDDGEDYKSRERTSSNGSSETSGTRQSSENMLRTKSVKDRVKETKASTGNSYTLGCLIKV